MNDLKLGVVLLAAGKSSRFGANKLLADFGGRPMICRTMNAMKRLPAARVIVVAGCMKIADLAKSYGYDVVSNGAPQLGQSHSIHLGVSAMRDMDAVLLLVADQPLLTADSLAALLRAFLQSGKGIACLKDETHMGNPAVFARRYADDLLGLAGDKGAKGILRNHPNDLTVVSCLYAHELSDADDPQTFNALLSSANP